MDFQGALDTAAANFDRSRDVLLACRPLLFGEHTVQPGEVVPVDQLTDEQAARLVRVRHARIDFGARRPVENPKAPRKAKKR